MKTFYSLILFVCFLSVSCKGQKTDEEKDQVDSFGLFIPKEPIGYVSDFDKIFLPAEIVFLDSIIINHEKQTTNNIAIVTYNLNSSLIESQEDFNKFSLTLFRKWGVGTKNKNNGIGILVCQNLRKIRIEVGYGLERKLTDEEAKKIIDDIIIPEFKRSDYFKGVSKGLEAIIKEIE